MKDMINTCQTAAAILEELLGYTGHIDDLLYFIAHDSDLGMTADQMLTALQDFIQTAKALG